MWNQARVNPTMCTASSSESYQTHRSIQLQTNLGMFPVARWNKGHRECREDYGFVRILLPCSMVHRKFLRLPLCTLRNSRTGPESSLQDNQRAPCKLKDCTWGTATRQQLYWPHLEDATGPLNKGGIRSVQPQTNSFASSTAHKYRYLHRSYALLS